MKLSYGKRKRLPSKDFALEKERKYPIHDIAHARNALARVSAFGTQAEKKEVKREVYAAYPSLRPGKVSRKVDTGLSKKSMRRLGL